MRIGYFIPGWPPDMVPNGIVATLGRLSEALEQQGHEVFFLTPHFEDSVPNPRIFVVKRPAARGLFDRLSWRFDFERTLYNKTASSIRDQLLLLLLEKNIDIFEIEETHGWAEIVARDIPIPVVTRLHGPWFTFAGINYPHIPPKRDKKRIEREGLAIRSAFAVSAPSNAVLESTRQHYEKITPLSKVIPGPMPCVPPEEAWNYKFCDRSAILFVGRFDELKGGDIVLRAFSELIKLRPNLRLIFVGPDNGVRLESGKFVRFAEFVQTNVSTQAAKRIEYLGPQPRSKIDGLRKISVMTIVASRYETFGNVVVEAMAVGVPLIATSVGGIAEILENEKNAILIEPDRPDALVSACLLLLGNPKLAIKLGHQSRKDCSERYYPEKVAKQTVEFYSQVIDQFSQRKLPE